MSHFVGLVFGSDIETLLEPYNESMEVEQYVRYTKDEAVDKVKEIHAANYEYAVEVVEKYKNPTTDWERGQLKQANETLDKGLTISYEEAWEEAKKWGYEIDDEENLLSTYNPDSKWDWYCEGGRWGFWLLLKEQGQDGEPLTEICAQKKDIDWDAMFEKDRVPFCFVTELGDWHESASMGWWAITTNEKDENDWINEFKDYLDTVSEDTFITVIDFHIQCQKRMISG